MHVERDLPHDIFLLQKHMKQSDEEFTDIAMVLITSLIHKHLAEHCTEVQANNV